MDYTLFVLLTLVELSIACERMEFEKITDMVQPKCDRGFLTTKTIARVECASLCGRLSPCSTFFHNPSDNTCRLASLAHMVVSDTAYSNTPVNTFEMFRKKGGFTKCEEIRQYHPTAGDGHYWIYPTASVLQHNALKVYCSDMDATIKHYISLPVANTGIYPEETFQKCRNHVYILTGCPGNQGVYHYSKIRFIPSTAEVTRSDRTYVTGSGKFYDYAYAADCYTELDNVYTCGPKGTFKINTLGTGLKVDPQLTWEKGGYKSKVVKVNSEGGAAISLTCGGYPGNCKPSSAMYLHPNTVDAVDLISAVFLQ